jgi:hypothetical protein
VTVTAGSGFGAAKFNPAHHLLPDAEGGSSEPPFWFWARIGRGGIQKSTKMGISKPTKTTESYRKAIDFFSLAYNDLRIHKKITCRLRAV